MSGLKAISTHCVWWGLTQSMTRTGLTCVLTKPGPETLHSCKTGAQTSLWHNIQMTYIRQRSMGKDRHWTVLKAGLLYYLEFAYAWIFSSSSFPFGKWVCSLPFRGTALLRTSTVHVNFSAWVFWCDWYFTGTESLGLPVINNTSILWRTRTLWYPEKEKQERSPFLF